MTKITCYLLIAAIAISGFFSCKKTEVNLPAPPAPESDSYVQFNVSGIQLTNTPLYALVSISNTSGEEVVVNQKITLDYIQGIYKTDKIKLAKADYKLSKFIVLTATDTAVYAIPKSNSPKASQVAKPLDISFTISQNVINNFSAEVLKINDTDAATSFGYNESDFGLVSYMSVSVKLKINVGLVVYDSLPGMLLINAVNGQGEQWIRQIDMQKGITFVRVPANYSSYRFEVAKWNITAVKNFAGTSIQPGELVELNANRQPKRLLEEASYNEAPGDFSPKTRTEYFYNTAGQLSEIKDYQKSIQVSGLPLTYIYEFKYSNNVLDTIYRYAPDNSNNGYTAFFYTAGKLSNMFNKSYDQETGAAIAYSTSNEIYKMKVDYLYDNGSSMVYNMNFIDGNKVSEQAISSNNGGESGAYNFDNNINPKHQLGYPDLYFTNSSKNNLIYEQKYYGGAIPQAVPYKFEYTYDTDGYPTEVYTSYKGYTSQQHLYRIKKTYKYQ